jgi:hypothetical protein
MYFCVVKIFTVNIETLENVWIVRLLSKYSRCIIWLFLLSYFFIIFSANIETDRALKSILDVLGRNSGLGAVRAAVLGHSPRLTDRGLAVMARRCSQLQQLGREVLKIISYFVKT